MRCFKWLVAAQSSPPKKPRPKRGEPPPYRSNTSLILWRMTIVFKEHLANGPALGSQVISNRTPAMWKHQNSLQTSSIQPLGGPLPLWFFAATCIHLTTSCQKDPQGYTPTTPCESPSQYHGRAAHFPPKSMSWCPRYSSVKWHKLFRYSLQSKIIALQTVPGSYPWRAADSLEGKNFWTSHVLSPKSTTTLLWPPMTGSIIHTSHVPQPQENLKQKTSFTKFSPSPSQAKAAPTFRWLGNSISSLAPHFS